MKEFGGYLPLELRRGSEWYTEESTGLGVARLNSGRTALCVALHHLGAQRVWAPSYYCPSVVTALREEGFEVALYPIKRDLLPDLGGVSAKDGSAVIFVDYFGLLGDRVKALSEAFPLVVLDNALAFYSEPIQRDGAVSIYSCRKFFGVCDGAYAIGSGVEQPDFPQDRSAEHSLHLLMSLEVGTNAAYKHSLANERRLGAERMLMSKLTRSILESIDYIAVRNTRRENYLALDEALADVQRLGVIPAEDAAPSAYPFFSGVPIREALVRQGVYVPRMWESWIDEPSVSRDCLEYAFSNYMSALPIDQRYHAEDMAKLAEIVRTILGELR